MCGSGTANILCAKAKLWDLKPKLSCGSGTAERQVAVYFLCGGGTTELPSGSGILDFKVIQYFMSGSGTAEIKVSVYF